MTKTIKAKAYTNRIDYQVFNQASGQVENLTANVYGVKMSTAKAIKYVKEECKERSEENKKNGIKQGKVIFLKVENVTYGFEIWELDFDEFMKYAHRA